jgi:hypothetical protein
MQTESSIGTTGQAPPVDNSAATLDVASAISADTNQDVAANDARDSSLELSAEDLDAQLDRDLREPAEIKEEEKPDQTQLDTKTEELVDDPFEDDRPRTREDFDRLFPRIPVAAREEMARIEHARAAAETIVSEIGGEPGVQFAKNLFPLISNPAPTWENVDSVMETVEAMNPILMGGITARLAQGIVEDDQLRPGFAEKLYQKEFGEGYDAKRIRELVAYDKVIHLTEEELAVAQNPPSERELQLERELQSVKATQAEIEAGRVREREVAKQQSIEHGEAFISRSAMEAVLPDAKRFGWTCEEGEENTPLGKAKIRFGEMQTAWMNQIIQKQPEYANIRQILERGQAFVDGKPTPLFTVNMTPLVNRARALFREAVRDMQSTFALGLKPRTATKKTPGTVDAPPLAKTPVKPLTSPNDEVARLDAMYDASMGDARTRAQMR